MDMNIVEFLNQLNFTALFLVFIISKILIETYLKIRNINSINENRKKIPERFINVVTDEEYKKSINYNIERIRFSILTSVFGVGVLLFFTIGGMLNSLTVFVQGVTSSNIVGAILLGLLLIVIGEIIEIPLAVYSTFYIEEKYGFNKTTTKVFVTDLFKNLLIQSIFASILYAIVISIIENLGNNWWIYAFIAVFLLQLIIFYIYPVLILHYSISLNHSKMKNLKHPLKDF